MNHKIVSLIICLFLMGFFYGCSGGSSGGGGAISLEETLPVSIASPADGFAIEEGEPFDFQGTISDGTAPYTCSWNFDGGADDASVEDPGDVFFVAPGKYTVTFAVTDSNGDSGSATVDVRVKRTLLEDLVISSVADIEAFQTEGYTDIDGGLDIKGTDLVDLSGFENLISVGGDLYMEYNGALTSLAGLDNITSVGGGLNIQGNNALTSLAGLENLTSVGGNLWIQFNDALTSLAGLENLTSVGGLSIGYNDALTSLAGLDNITSVGGGLVIEGNNALTSLAGLENLTSVGHNLVIYGNEALTSLDLVDLCFVGGAFTIRYNGQLCQTFATDLRDQVIACQGGEIVGGVTLSENRGDCP